jgi:hypothetical protein
MGVIAESVPNRTLSSIEEGGARISQRPKSLLERLGRPDVVAIEADVLPAERGNVGEQLVGQSFGLGAKLGNGVAEVDGVPEGDGGDREVEAGGTVALWHERITHYSVPLFGSNLNDRFLDEVFKVHIASPNQPTSPDR